MKIEGANLFEKSDKLKQFIVEFCCENYLEWKKMV
jgi:hypothetical protein